MSIVPRSYSRYAQMALKLLGKEIETGRKSKRITAESLAQRCGISRPTLRKIERGEPTVEIGVVFEAAAIVGIKSDRIGALDFQTSSDKYVPRANNNASLEELLNAAERVDQGLPLTPEIDTALNHGSSIGGARPKALMDDGNKKYIAKFSSSSDTYNVVKAEFVAMRLAKLAGINAAEVQLRKASGKDVLLIERFDRVKMPRGYARKPLISALTLLELDEMMARYASYKDLTDIIRARFENPRDALAELFKRLVFNVLVSNNDDHARNHAALWDGSRLTLSPAYDLCPQRRSGRESNQAMFISETDKRSRLETCIQASNQFLIKRKDALTIVEELMATVAENFSKVCNEGELVEVDRSLMHKTQVFSDYAFEGLNEEAKNLFRIKNSFSKSDIEGLLKFGGFPDPYFAQSEKESKLWRRERLYRVVNDDIAGLENLREYSTIEALADSLPERVGSPLSLNSLAEDLGVNPKTVAHWVEILEKVYYCYRIAPYGAPKIRAVKKEQKAYLWDWSSIENIGIRFENMVAGHLLKHCHFIEDTEGDSMELRFVRDHDRREVDFVVIKNKKPLFAVECKTGERQLSPSIRYFKERTKIPYFYQVHLGSKDYLAEEKIRVLPFGKFCEEVMLA